jgi:pimeloyl-ACP methyl ester carboxylesterase
MILCVAVALVAVGCGSSDEPAATTTAVPTTSAVSTSSTSTIDPTPSSMNGPPEVAGIWMVDFGGAVLQFRLDAGPDDEITGVFDSVSEGVSDLPVSVSVDETAVTIEIPAAQAVFEGTVDDNTFSGVWMQGGAEIPMEFARQTEPFALSRPQEPQPPFPYEATDVVFPNEDFALAGTLIVPEGPGPFPAAVLISGSGPQDRDESLAGHKPFLVLADALARQGIATLRFDDRGFGSSTGDPLGATTADLATDTKAAVDFLRQQPKIAAIGLIGHSEGGLIAPMVAIDSPDAAFVVLLAGPGLPGGQILLTQTEELMRAEGVPEASIEWRMGWNDDLIALAASDKGTLEVTTEMKDLLSDAAATAPADMLSQVSSDAIDQLIATFTDPWMRYFLAYDPAPALADLEIPVLAMIGELDLQVSAGANTPVLEAALAANSDATVLSLPGLNHIFQNAATGAVSEYAQLDETFDPATLQAIADWILARF